ncbi:unnamed protein product [Pedinophyceae sp. YPF-701]|nr:unnamed protein product [Pedinophyceae sp. YPF-701]
MKRSQPDNGDDRTSNGGDTESQGPDKRQRTEGGSLQWGIEPGMSKRGRGRGFARRALRVDRLPTIVYREGEQLKELEKYLAADGEAQQVEIRIAPEYMNSNNKMVKTRQLWGCDVYTQDSDLVAAIMHMGFFSYKNGSPPHNVGEFRAVVRPVPPQESYKSKSRNGVFSRAWVSPGEGCSYQVESVRLITRQGHYVELEPMPQGATMAAPTFVPAHHDKMMTTRQTSAMIERRQRMVPEVGLQFNLCNEPWLKYSPGVVADRGLKPSTWTCARLTRECLYLETHRQRFELSHAQAGEEQDRFRLSRMNKAQPFSSMVKAGIPAPASDKVMLHDALHWEELHWGQEGLQVKDKLYKVTRVQFIPLCQAAGEDMKE